MRLSGSLLIATSLLLLSASAAQADSVSMVLTSSGSGEFDYALHQPGNVAEVDFVAGETITLSGLDGVTGATVSSDFLGANFVPTFTSTSVTLTLDAVSLGIVNGSPGPSNPGFNIGFLQVFSSAPAGLVNYDIAAQLGSYDISNQNQFTGLVEGPVATPEPASFILLCYGMVGLWMASFRLPSCFRQLKRNS